MSAAPWAPSPTWIARCRALRARHAALRALISLASWTLPMAASLSNASAAPNQALPARSAVDSASTLAPQRQKRSALAFRRELDAALEHYSARRFSEARAAFLRALELAPPNTDRPSLEFNIAACEYELGAFRDAEARFLQVADDDANSRAAALLQAGWAALGAGDDLAARAHLEQAPPEAALQDERDELARAIDSASSRRGDAELERDLEAAARAYEAGDRQRARRLVDRARSRPEHSAPRTRAALAYLDALLARDQGDDERARRTLERSLVESPDDVNAQLLLAELALARGDRARAEQYYRASLGGDLSERDAGSVREALAALYPLPRPGLDAWAALGAGYDSNATLSGSGETLGVAGAARQGSPFAAPVWSIEQRWVSGERSRIGAYYAGDWLVFGAVDAASVSLLTQEAGVRLYLAPTPTTELRFSAGAGPTFSGHSLEPFSLDALLRGRLSLQHAAHWRTLLLGELRPSLGLGGQDYLSGLRADATVGERFESGPWSFGLGVGWRHNGIGAWSLPASQAIPGCIAGCQDARYHIPLGYAGPLVDAEAGVELTSALELDVTARYEHRTFLDASQIDGADVPAFVSRLSSKTRADDRYSLGGRARYRLNEAPELGAWLQYALRVSRSNVAFGSGGIDHAFDYDDRNFSQHVIELGLDARY